MNDKDDICANRHGGNEFSDAANLAVAPFKPTIRQRILDLLEEHPEGLICEEIEQKLGLVRSTASARMAELKALDLVEENGSRKTSRGKLAGVWRIKRREVNVLHPN
jgi:hypothetical protein